MLNKLTISKGQLFSGKPNNNVDNNTANNDV